MNYRKLFDALHPGFFDAPGIRSLPPEAVFSEMILPRGAKLPGEDALPCPEGISFGIYEGPLAALRETVAKVNPDWVQYFNEGGRVYCALDGDKPVSFCILDGMGWFEGRKIAGPGCVGTLPSYRKQGIGLMMVRRATALLWDEGADLSYIHYTHLARWYGRLGYETVLRWGRDGVIWSKDE